MTDDYLVHYGVLGMKWGVRKQRKQAIKSAKKSNRKEIDKINAKYDVKKYGGKKKAITKISNKAELARKARTIAKKGAGILSSSYITTGALHSVWATGAQSSIAWLGFSALSDPLLSIPIAALGTGAAIYASKAKGKTSRSSKKRIQNIKNYT